MQIIHLMKNMVSGITEAAAVHRRETIGRVAAGAIAVKILEELGINVCAYSSRIGGINIDYNNFDLKERDNNAFNMPDSNAAMQVEKYADEKLKEQDSMGGIIECVVTGMMAGVGDPVFEKLDANLAKAIMSIGAVKGFEIGDGFAAADSTGSTNNDSFTIKDGRIVKKTNHSGGVLGGMSGSQAYTFNSKNSRDGQQIWRRYRGINKGKTRPNDSSKSCSCCRGDDSSYSCGYDICQYDIKN